MSDEFSEWNAEMIKQLVKDHEGAAAAADEVKNDDFKQRT